ncbi:MAG: hypothetical protein IJW45_02800 [Oscillospiraceae bacterium]|nr:hypothetical protein [Oscillospiraceae bacterium]
MLKRIIAPTIAVLMALACAGCAQEAPPATVVTTAPTTQTTTPPTTEPPPPETTVPPEPDTVSILDFLTTATQPVGSTMYVWGGGWNEEDTGAGIEAVTLGLPSQWAAFADEQDAYYDHKETRYQIHDGLDCSGYIGWAVYNTLETSDGRPGYVCSSTKMAQQLSDRGLGEYIPAERVTHWVPGDIMSMSGHCWIVVGMCDDGSVLLLHASPPGVMFSGTTAPDGSSTQATALAEQIMAEHYPDWYTRYPHSARPYSYLTQSSALRWSDVMLDDKEGLRQMSAQEVVQLLFPAD